MFYVFQYFVVLVLVNMVYLPLHADSCPQVRHSLTLKLNVNNNTDHAITVHAAYNGYDGLIDTMLQTKEECFSFIEQSKSGKGVIELCGTLKFIACGKTFMYDVRYDETTVYVYAYFVDDTGDTKVSYKELMFDQHTVFGDQQCMPQEHFHALLAKIQPYKTYHDRSA